MQKKNRPVLKCHMLVNRKEKYYYIWQAHPHFRLHCNFCIFRVIKCDVTKFNIEKRKLLVYRKENIVK